MPNDSKILVFSILTVGLVMMLTACGGGTEERDKGAESATVEAREAGRASDAPSEAGGATPATSPILELLGAVPDTPETRSWVEFHNHHRFQEVFDIHLPGSEADEDALGDYLHELLDLPLLGGPWISRYGTFALQALGRRQHLGFDLRNVQRSVEAGQPQMILEVVRGGFDPEATDRALSACSECKSPIRQEHRGVAFYSWGEDFNTDFKNLFAPPAFEQLGRGGRIAVQEDYVFRTVETEGMQALIDASLGKRRSLADVEEFRLLAQGLAELGAFSAFLSDSTQSLDYLKEQVSQLVGSGPGMEQEMQQLEGSVLLRRYEAFATGAGKDDRGNYMALVLVHRSERRAQENVDLLQRRIQEGRSMVFADTPWSNIADGMEIQTDGKVLLAKLRGPGIGRSFWVSWVLPVDPLILHG